MTKLKCRQVYLCTSLHHIIVLHCAQNLSFVRLLCLYTSGSASTKSGLGVGVCLSGYLDGDLRFWDLLQMVNVEELDNIITVVNRIQRMFQFNV
jgi:hypothetical protein